MSFHSTFNFPTSHFVNTWSISTQTPIQLQGICIFNFHFIYSLWFITLSYPYCYFHSDNLEMSKTKTQTQTNIIWGTKPKPIMFSITNHTRTITKKNVLLTSLDVSTKFFPLMSQPIQFFNFLRSWRKKYFEASRKSGK